MIIENTEEAKNEAFKNRYGSRDYEVTVEDIAALIFGQCLVLDDGKYVSYITFKKPE